MDLCYQSKSKEHELLEHSSVSRTLFVAGWWIWRAISLDARHFRTHGDVASYVGSGSRADDRRRTSRAKTEARDVPSDAGSAG